MPRINPVVYTTTCSLPEQDSAMSSGKGAGCMAIKRAVSKAKASVRQFVRRCAGRKQRRGPQGQESTPEMTTTATVDDTVAAATTEEVQPLLPSSDRQDDNEDHHGESLEDVSGFWSRVTEAMAFINNDDKPLRARLRCEFPEIQAYLRAEEGTITFPLPGTDDSYTPPPTPSTPYGLHTAPIDFVSRETQAEDLQLLDDFDPMENLQEIIWHMAARALGARGLPEEMLENDFITTRMIGVVGSNALVRLATGFDLGRMRFADEQRTREVEDGTNVEYMFARQVGTGNAGVTITMTDR